MGEVLLIRIAPRLAPLLCAPLAGCYWMIWDPHAPDLPDSALWEVSCGPGEIRSLSNGKVYDSLAEAFEDVSGDAGFCLGEGTHLPGQISWTPGPSFGSTNTLRVVGAGSGATTLAGPSETADMIYGGLLVEVAGRVEIEGLTLSGFPISLTAGEASLTDLVLQAKGGISRLANLDANTLDVSGLTVSDSWMTTSNALCLDGDGTVRDLWLHDNTLSAGHLVETHRSITLVDPLLYGNGGMDELSWTSGIEAYGPLVVVGGALANNSLTGSVIDAWDQLQLQDTVIEENVAVLGGPVYQRAAALMSGGSLWGNRARTGAFELEGSAVLQLDGVNFGLGEELNEPCDVALNLTGSTHALCIGQELGADASVSCDIDGCL